MNEQLQFAFRNAQYQVSVIFEFIKDGRNVTSIIVSPGVEPSPTEIPSYFVMPVFSETDEEREPTSASGAIYSNWVSAVRPPIHVSNK